MKTYKGLHEKVYVRRKNLIRVYLYIQIFSLYLHGTTWV